MILAGRAVGPIAANCYILGCSATKAAAVIDPGADDPWIRATVQKLGLQVRCVLLTHSHMDHIGGVGATRAWSGAPVWIHAAEEQALADPQLNFSTLYGSPVSEKADRLLHDGEVVELGQLRLLVLHTPGHSPGGISLYLQPQGVVFSGDALFAGSIGRTDIPGAQPELLVPGIKARLLTLPRETVVYPGHGPETTIGDEAEYNPFL